MTLGTLFEQICILSPKGSFIPNINAFCQVVHEKKIFEYVSKFPYFAPYWAPKETSRFIWTNLNPHTPSMIPTKFGWNWPSGSWEEVD